MVKWVFSRLYTFLAGEERRAKSVEINWKLNSKYLYFLLKTVLWENSKLKFYQAIECEPKKKKVCFRANFKR